jgi:hypothetical protein
MRQGTIISLRTSQSGGINSVCSEPTDQEFFSKSASYFAERDALEARLREVDRQIRDTALEFSNREKMWGVNPTILRRELKLRGFGV